MHFHCYSVTVVHNIHKTGYNLCLLEYVIRYNGVWYSVREKYVCHLAFAFELRAGYYL